MMTCECSALELQAKIEIYQNQHLEIGVKEKIDGQTDACNPWQCI